MIVTLHYYADETLFELFEELKNNWDTIIADRQYLPVVQDIRLVNIGGISRIEFDIMVSEGTSPERLKDSLCSLLNLLAELYPEKNVHIAFKIPRIEEQDKMLVQDIIEDWLMLSILN